MVEAVFVERVKVAAVGKNLVQHNDQSTGRSKSLWPLYTKQYLPHDHFLVSSFSVPLSQRDDCKMKICTKQYAVGRVNAMLARMLGQQIATRVSYHHTRSFAQISSYYLFISSLPYRCTIPNYKNTRSVSCPVAGRYLLVHTYILYIKPWPA